MSSSVSLAPDGGDDRANEAIVTPTPARSGNLYVQFPSEGWRWGVDQLRRSCEALVKRYPSIADAAQSEGKSVEQFLMDVMFADLMPARFALAKLTLAPRRDAVSVNVSVRLSADARPNWPFPKGVSLVAKASWTLARISRDTQEPSEMRNPALAVFSFHDGPPGEPRDFEVALDVTCRQQAKMGPGARRERNVLSQVFPTELPAISTETAERLQDWSDFLEWKRRLIRANRTAVRYVSRRLGDDLRSVSFRIVGENADTLSKAVGQLTRSQSPVAFDTSVSEHEWEFQLPSEGREPRGSELGSARRARLSIASDQSAAPGSSWGDPVSADVIFALSDDALAKIEGSDAPDLVAGHALDRIPETGFIGQTAVQDLSQVVRHERALRDLSDQGGFSPYLARYMFDAAEARTPKGIATVDRWYNDRLNDAQQLAVRKVISAPDLCLIQGPPGTGKTTVIAEAIAQVVERGETVLVASQTHTAVDNALSRLPLHPSIRAVRLTRNEDRLSDEGQEFLNEKALRRYYRSLSAEIAQRHADAATELKFAAEISAFRLKSRQILATLDSAESSQVAATERRDAFVEDYALRIQSFATAGVATPPIDIGRLERGQLDDLDQWLDRLRVGTRLARDCARAVLAGKSTADLFRKSESLLKIEGQLESVLERMKVDSTAVTEYQRLQAELLALDSETSSDAWAPADLARLFPEAATVFAEPRMGPLALLAIFTLPARQNVARKLLEVTNFVDGALPLLDEARRSLLEAQSEWDDAKSTHGFALAAAEAHFTIPFAGSLGISLAELPRESGALAQAQQEAEARLKGRIERATRLSAESDSWREIQEEWVADLSDDALAARDWEAIGDEWLAECNVVGVTCNENPATLDEPGLTNGTDARIGDI